MPEGMGKRQKRQSDFWLGIGPIRLEEAGRSFFGVFFGDER